MRARSLFVVLVSAMLLLLSGCFSGKQPPKASGYVNYVALGDSYSAGPGITPVAKNSPVFCSRSMANYPSYLSVYLRVKKLTDMTCSGATTGDFFSSQSIRQKLPQNAATKTPPQLDGLSTKTDLVTVGIGGNDLGTFRSILTSLAVDNANNPLPMSNAKAIEPLIENALDAIKKRAPHARIVVVGYLRVLPTDGVCPLSPVGKDKIKEADAIERQINASVAAAAKAKQATFIDSYAISKGHDICAGSKAWVNGQTNALFQAAAYHPFRTGMNAVARQIYLQLTKKTAPKNATSAALANVSRQ